MEGAKHTEFELDVIGRRWDKGRPVCPGVFGYFD